MVGYLAASLFLFFFTRHWFWIAVAAPGLVASAFWIRHRLRERALLRGLRRQWEPRGLRCLLVYSDSPVWRDHIEAHWLPRFGRVAEVLNWSERANWRPTLAVRLFDHFCGRTDNFNPSVVVFRVGQRPLVFRFFHAFHEAKRGDAQFVTALERQMFLALNIPGSEATS